MIDDVWTGVVAKGVHQGRKEGQQLRCKYYSGSVRQCGLAKGNDRNVDVVRFLIERGMEVDPRDMG